MRSNMDKQTNIAAKRKAAELGHNIGMFLSPDAQGFQFSYCGNRPCTARLDFDNYANERNVLGRALTEPCPY